MWEGEQEWELESQLLVDVQKNELQGYLHPNPDSVTERKEEHVVAD